MSAKAVEAATTQDGRNIDPALGRLAGEGAQLEVRRPAEDSTIEGPIAPADALEPTAQDDPSYYDRPVLKEPVWEWAIPAYFFVGGLAGATSALGAAAELVDRRGLARLARTTRWVGFVGDGLSAGLLVYDLGRPARFLNMLRVFRPTSPMSVGTYVLAGSGATNALALLLGGRAGALGAAGRLASGAAGVLGLPLAGYTAVLLANTAVPLWQGAHRALPFLFVGSAVASAGALLSLLPLERRERAVARRYLVAGALASLAGGAAVEREVAHAPRAALALRRGFSGALWSGARTLTAASLALSVLPVRPRWRAAAAVLGLAGALATRFAVLHAGKASARDPRATFHPQRARLEAPGRSTQLAAHEV